MEVERRKPRKPRDSTITAVVEEYERQVDEKDYPPPEELCYDPGQLLVRAAQLIRFYEALNNPELRPIVLVHQAIEVNLAFVTLDCTGRSHRTQDVDTRKSPDVHAFENGLYSFNPAAVTCGDCKAKKATENI